LTAPDSEICDECNLKGLFEIPESVGDVTSDFSNYVSRTNVV